MLDDHGLPADHVGRSVQQQRRRHAAGESAIDGLILVVEGVLHHHLRRYGTGGLVYIVIQCQVRVGIDYSGREIFSARINDGG